MTAAAPAPVRVVVTRPEREALRWAADLSARGLAPVVLPLIVIAPAADSEPVRQAWADLTGCQAAMFVSSNAVEHFFASNVPDVRFQWSSNAIKTRAWATGPGTRDALRQAGLPATTIDAPGPDATQFDSEALWRLVAPGVNPGQPVLIVRGSDAHGRSAGRDWLAQQLDAVGVASRFVVAYERRPPVFSAAQRAAAAQAASDGSVWLFSSSEAVANLRDALPGQRWDAARAVATHPRIAQAAREAGFGTVQESRPNLDDVIPSIESVG